MSVYPLTGIVRPYAWGSRTSLAELQGRSAPTVDPEAELWLGAHPDDPAIVTRPDGPISLDSLIASDPAGQLGAGVAGEFGPRLPYLMKVLAAESPLSLQAHPDAEYAKQAYSRQQADPSLPRNYTDAYHKPEMLVALTPFEALCGFRAPETSAAALEAFGVPALAPVVEALRAGDLRTAVRDLLTWPDADRKPLIEAVVAAAPSPDADLAARLAGYFPGDPGVLVALLLNHVRLEPGQAIWMPAGNLHAYLRGTGVELMAASDNVLRGGLTPKHVDRAELQHVLDFTPGPVSRLEPIPVTRHVVTYRPASVGSGAGVDFELLLVTGDATIQTGSAAIALAVDGDFALAADGVRAGAARGAILFVDEPAEIAVTGSGRLFLATGSPDRADRPA